jgi:vacuolar-type H+-ATPase subunit H
MKMKVVKFEVTTNNFLSIMLASNDPRRNNIEQTPLPSGNGLDDPAVLFLINSLIEQNSELAGKLDQIDTLLQLAEEGIFDVTPRVEPGTAEMDSNAVEKISAADREAQEILRAAREEAESIKRVAEKEALRILQEAKARAAQDALLIKKEAEQLLQKGKALAGSATAKTSSTEGEGASTGGNEEQSSLEYETAKRELAALYDGIVELHIPPPISVGPLRDLTKLLQYSSGIKILSLDSTANRGLKMKLFLQKPVPLIKILKSMPQVERVLGESSRNQSLKVCPEPADYRSIQVKIRK